MTKKCRGCGKRVFDGSQEAAAAWCRTGGKCPLRGAVPKTKNDLRAQAAADDSCLGEIRKALEGLGVEMDACPPMFYPAAVMNVATWTARAARQCHVDHGWHGGDDAAVAACIRTWIVEHQKQESAR